MVAVKKDVPILIVLLIPVRIYNKKKNNFLSLFFLLKAFFLSLNNQIMSVFIFYLSSNRLKKKP